MSQLQGLAAVTGLVVAYNSCAVAYQSWITATDERWDAEYNQAIDKSFLAGGSEIQYEYENHVASLGPRFSSGDGTLRSFQTWRILLTFSSHCKFSARSVSAKDPKSCFTPGIRMCSSGLHLPSELRIHPFNLRKHQIQCDSDFE
jgi:hypothetical protein